MTADSTYSLFAKFYDAYVSDYTSDIPFYLQLASACGPPVLEVGCGTGRVLLPLLRAGLAVTGVDISEEMLSRARAKIAQEKFPGGCALANHDLADAPLPGAPFALALVTFYTFNYLLTPDRQSSFLENLAACLRPGARIAMHLFHPLPLRRPELADRWVDKGSYRLGGTEVTLRDKRRMLDDRIEERIQVFRFASGRQEEIRTVRRFVDQQEARRLLLRAGFTDIRVAEDFAPGILRPLAEEDLPAEREFVVVGERVGKR